MNTINNIPAMTPRFVHTYLRELGRQWNGQGVAVELGSWLGATAVSLLEGLVEAGYNRPMYCYDRWEANKEEVQKAKLQGVRIKDKQDLLPSFRGNAALVYNNVKTIKGKIQETIQGYPKDPIEFCLLDAPKREPVFSIAINVLSKYWIPGVTVLGLMDYYFYLDHKEHQRLFRAPVRFIKNNVECFEKLMEWPCECESVFFKYIKPLKTI